MYNSQFFLVECLNSVINQTLKNIEIVCIDDGSTDNSSNILKIYSQYDNRFVLINQENEGPGLARNKGIEISKGKYISFLDSDDMYYNDIALELLYRKAKNNKAIICGGGMKKFKDKKDQRIINITSFNIEGFIKYEDYQYDYDYQRFIYNKNFLRMKKLYFPRYLRYQDPPFFIKTMFTAREFYATKNITHVYRKNTDKDLNIKQVIDMFYGLNDCLKFSKKKKLYHLYNTTLNRLNTKLFLKGVKKFSQNNNLRKTIIEIIKSINKEIIQKYNLNFTLNELYKTIIENITFCL